MNEIQRASNGASAHARPSDAPSLDRIVNQTTQQMQRRNDYLTRRLPTIESVLPPFLAKQGQRLIKRALAYVMNSDSLRDISDDELYLCVLQAAECGIMIDGVRGYIVPYKRKWQFQAHYAAIIASLRRHQVIEDCYGDVICENDRYEAYRESGRSYLVHQFDLRKPRGNVIGAYGVVVLPGGSWRYEQMSLEELDAIERRSPSKKGPWSNPQDKREMQKKTVFRRLLKLYLDDVGILSALAEPWEDDLAEPATSATDRVMDRLKPSAFQQKEFVPAESLPARQTDQPGDGADEKPEEAIESQAETSQETLAREELGNELAGQIDSAANAAEVAAALARIEESRAAIGDAIYTALKKKAASRFKSKSGGRDTSF